MEDFENIEKESAMKAQEESQAQEVAQASTQSQREIRAYSKAKGKGVTKF